MFFQAEDGIRDLTVTGVQTCALPIYNFLFAICGCTPDWTPGHFIEHEVERIRTLVGPTQRAICGLSGGVDSAVAAPLVHRAIGDRLTSIFVDPGLLLRQQREQV